MLAKMKTDKKLKPQEAEFRSTVSAENSHMRKLAFEIYVHNSSKRGYRNMRKIAKKRLNSERYKLRGVAGRKVKQQLKEMRSQIRQILEGNEFLRYEIFAGSGEDIRYQAAGGKTLAGNRIPANVKPQKILNWNLMVSTGKTRSVTTDLLFATIALIARDQWWDVNLVK